jgi:hypothetical protein
MEKGKLGLRLSFYAVFAFILAWCGYTTLLFFLAGVVLLVEKDEWTLRQVMQAFGLCILVTVIRSVFGIVDFISDIPFVGVAWGVILSVIYGIIDLVVLISTIIAILNNLKGKDANVFLIRKFVDWAFGGQFVVKTMNEIVDDVKDVAEDVKEAIDNKKE